MIYQAVPDSTAGRALDYLVKAAKSRPEGAWIRNVEVSTFLGVKPNAVRPSLHSAIAAGVVEKSLDSSGYLQWRPCIAKSRRKTAKTLASPTFGIGWPPRFESKFDSVEVASYETRRK